MLSRCSLRQMSKKHYRGKRDRRGAEATIRTLLSKHGLTAVLNNSLWQRNIILKVNRDLQNEVKVFNAKKPTTVNSKKETPQELMESLKLLD